MKRYYIQLPSLAEMQGHFTDDYGDEDANDGLKNLAKRFRDAAWSLKQLIADDDARDDDDDDESETVSVNEYTDGSVYLEVDSPGEITDFWQNLIDRDIVGWEDVDEANDDEDEADETPSEAITSTIAYAPNQTSPTAATIEVNQSGLPTAPIEIVFMLTEKSSVSLDTDAARRLRDKLSALLED